MAKKQARQRISGARERRNRTSARYLHESARAHIERGDTARGVADLRAALLHDGDNVEILTDLGAMLGRTGRLCEAADLLYRANARRPGDPVVLSNLAIALRKAHRDTEAIRISRAACEADARNPKVFENLAMALNRMGDAVGAAEASLTASALKDSAGEPVKAARHRRNAALKLIRAGHFTRGFELYRVRRQIPADDCSEVLGGREIAPEEIDRLDNLTVIAEQGVGDQLMCAGLLHELSALVPHVTLLCDPRLTGLLAQAFPDVEVLDLPQDAAPIRLATGTPYIHMFDVLAILRTQRHAWRSLPAFLTADAARTRQLRARYRGDDAKPLVGIAWRSGNRVTGKDRSLPLSRWGEILQLPNVRFVALQYGDVGAEVDYARARFEADVVYDANLDSIADLTGFAAQVAAMDCVVSIDNTTVHMAGALGVPCIAMLAEPADWRWLTPEASCSWYESVTLVRQASHGDWEAPIAAAADRAAAFTRVAANAVTHTSETPRAKAPASLTGRALILNDTSEWYHWGCTGTSFALHRILSALGYQLDTLPIDGMTRLWPVPRSLAAFDDEATWQAYRTANPKLMDRITAADVVVVNGEGSIHGDRENVLSLFYLIYLAATRFNRPVHIVNHSAYAINPTLFGQTDLEALYRKIYGAAAFVAVREPRSQQHLADLGLATTLSFDCLPIYIAEHYTGPKASERGGYIVMAGSAAMTPHQAAEFVDFAGTLAASGKRVRFLHGAAAQPSAEDAALAARLDSQLGQAIEIVEARSLTAWLDVIAGADTLISGRFHYMIAAACLGTPMVPFTSNTGKIDGLLNILGAAPAIELAHGFTSALDDAVAKLAVVEDEPSATTAERLETLCRLALRNFDGLASANTADRTAPTRDTVGRPSEVVG